MIKPETVAVDEVVAAPEAAVGRPAQIDPPSRWETRRKLLRHRAETERLRVLVEFVSKPVHAHGGTEPDPDIITAYNLAVEAALRGIRRAAMAEDVEVA